MAELFSRDRNKTKALEQLKKQAVDARAPFDKDMQLNLAFFLDHQHTEWLAEAQMIRQIPRDERSRNAPRPVSNKIMHFVMQEHAFVQQDKPTVDVLPASEHPLDISHANVSLAYTRWLADPAVADFETELSDATFWALVAGEGYLKWVYDRDEKRPDMTSVSPLDVYVDPYAKRFDRARWIIHEQFMDPEEVKARYNKEVAPSKADAQKTALLREMGQAPVLEGCVVNELWVKPGSPGYPNGLFVVWSGKDLLVEPSPFPYKHGRLPFTILGSIPRPNTPHFTCAVKYLRSPQMELNKYHAQKLQTRESFANPKWWIPTELELESDPDDSTAQILRGHSQQGSLKPEIIQGSLMMDSQDGEWIKNEMMDVVGLHEVSQAQVPGRVEAAKAIEMLKEADQSRLSEMNRTVKVAVSQGFYMLLMLAKQYSPAEQIVQTYSPEGYPEVHKFKAADLKDSLRIRVTMGTGLSKSRAARQEGAMVLWQNGVIQDPEIFAQLMDVPIDTLSPQRAYDIRLARNENLEIASEENGVAVVPNSWDAHDVHIREHNNYRKTAEFRKLSTECKQKFEFHVQQHEALELKELEKQALKQQLLQGAVPPGAEEDQDPNAGGAPV